MPAKENCRAKSARPGFRLKAISLAVMSAAFISSASAAGLGKITVLSGLGQPLNAEIELTTGSREEANGLAVKLASAEAFRQANVEINPALYSLRFVIEQRGGRSVVRITSAQPLNEPFVDLLLEVTGNNSKLVREYTFLLDPPELRKPQTALAELAKPATPAAGAAMPAAGSAANAPESRAAQPPARARAANRSTARAAAEPNATAPNPAREATAAAASAIDKESDAARELEVKRGDTLGRLAAEARPEGVSLDQMLVALYRANPQAFVGNNMNRLRAGQILKVPQADAVSAISQGEARSVIVAQAADFNAYRGKLAGQVAHAAPSAAAEPGQSAGGKITSRVQEQANPVNTAKDKLTVSRSGLTQGGKANAAEDKLASEKAAADAAARVKELEKNVGDLQKLLELKNKDLADKQAAANQDSKLAQAGKPAEAAAGAAAGAAPATATPAPAGAATPAAPGAAAAPAAGEPAASAPAAAVPAAPAAVPPKPVAKPKIVVPPPPPPPTLMEELLDNPLLLGAGGLVLAGLAGLGIRVGRRRRAQQKNFGDSVMMSDTQMATNSLFGTSGGQSVDTSSVFNSSFTPSASQLDTNEVDPVAEADVYIAYGRDAQAEEILKEALRTQPERHAVRLKLLEIYASRKDLRAFDTVASELYSMTKGECPEWPQAAELGAAVDPGNPLYANAKPKAPLAASQDAGEELDLDALLNTTTGGAGVESEPAPGAASLDFDDANLEALAAPDAGPEAKAAEPTLASAPDEDDGNLMDFALSTAAEAPPLPKAEPPAMAAEENDGNTLDFDFDLGKLGAQELTPPATATAAAEVPELQLPVTPTEPASSAADDANPALDFNFDLIKPPATPETPVAAAAAGDKLDVDDLAELEELELSLPALDEPAPPEAGNAGPATPVQPLDFDLGGLNLDLDTPATADPGLLDLSGSSSGGNAEMATKLDLALAYQEIGDVEGARELLDEVLKGGSAEQVEKAQSLLEKLA